MTKTYLGRSLGDSTTYQLPKGVTTWTPYQDSTPFINENELRDALATKVDKNGTDSLMTADEHTKLAAIDVASDEDIQALVDLFA
ncbi:hypothetical protein FACS189499_03990 [Clostridia bacterium]|nr:hypothetical protein FACS189499_03990 [Clostridia bacterium]